MFFPKVDIEKGQARQSPLVSKHIRSVSAQLSDKVVGSLHGDSFIVSSGFGNAQMVVVPFSTQECDQVDVLLSVDSFLDSYGAGLAQVSVYPQISINGIHWYELWANGFTTITSGTSFPFWEHKLLEVFGAFMRFSISFMDPMGGMASMGATLEIMGNGRNC